VTIKETILKLNEKYGSVELGNLLCSGSFFSDPASAQYHHNSEGGLAEHSLGVFLRMLDLISDPDPEIIKPCFKIAMCHDLCKVGTYKKVKKSQLVKDKDGNLELDFRGKKQWVDAEGWDKISFTSPVLGHADQSIIIALRAGIELTDNELMAIRWHMGAYETQGGENSYRMSRAMELSKSVVYTQTADLMDSKIPMTTEQLIQLSGEYRGEG